MITKYNIVLIFFSWRWLTRGNETGIRYSLILKKLLSGIRMDREHPRKLGLWFLGQYLETTNPWGSVFSNFFLDGNPRNQPLQRLSELGGSFWNRYHWGVVDLKKGSGNWAEIKQWSFNGYRDFSAKTSIFKAMVFFFFPRGAIALQRERDF